MFALFPLYLSLSYQFQRSPRRMEGDTAGKTEMKTNRYLEKFIAPPVNLIAKRNTREPVKPQPGAQEMFLNTSADIALFGGAAGGGKSMAGLLDCAQAELIENPQYRAVAFRKSYPQISSPGGLWSASEKVYPAMGATPKESALQWVFPSGAKIEFRHLQHEKNKYDWQGAELIKIFFDELTHFSEGQFWYLLGRNRTTTGIKTTIRATCNPDADSWVAKFIDWWIGDDGLPIKERAGVIRWFIRDRGEVIWGDSPEKLGDRYPGQLPKSFTFIPATIYDNPELLKKDPGYLGNLQAQHPVERARLLEGNWRVKFESGTVFNREWFRVVDHADQGATVRFWDIAATAKELAKKSSYYTAGVKMSKRGDQFTVLDMVAKQKGAGAVEELIVAIAQQDGPRVKVRWEQEGGSSGILWCENLKKRLQSEGFNADYVKPLADKVSRAIPLATDAIHGNVALLRSPWNEEYLNCLQRFDGSPSPLVNDVTDASTGAHKFLTDFSNQRLPRVKDHPNAPAKLKQVFG